MKSKAKRKLPLIFCWDGSEVVHQPENYNTFEKKPILTPQFFAEELALISPTEYQTNVQKVAAIKIGSSLDYPKKILALFTKVQAKSSFWDLPVSEDLLEADRVTQGKRQDTADCNLLRYR